MPIQVLRQGPQTRTSSTFCMALTVLCTSCLSYFSGLFRLLSISKVASCNTASTHHFGMSRYGSPPKSW